MTYLSVIGSAASIVSLFVSLFVAFKVIKIGNSIRVDGNRNITTGGNISVRGR